MERCKKASLMKAKTFSSTENRECAKFDPLKILSQNSDRIAVNLALSTTFISG